MDSNRNSMQKRGRRQVKEVFSEEKIGGGLLLGGKQAKNMLKIFHK
jgi:hypothetical protein